MYLVNILYEFYHIKSHIRVYFIVIFAVLIFNIRVVTSIVRFQVRVYILGTVTADRSQSMEIVFGRVKTCTPYRRRLYFVILTVALGRPVAISWAIINSLKSKYVYLSKYICVMYIVVVDLMFRLSMRM